MRRSHLTLLVLCFLAVGCAGPSVVEAVGSERVVLFDGGSTDAWRPVDSDGPIRWRVVEGELEVDRSTGDIITRRDFADCHLHLEWKAPLGGEGQRAANSGVKVQGYYEVQILGPDPDAPPAKNTAGAIYAHKAADVNASVGRTAWQTFDIHFTAARWVDGVKVSNARMTVRWNGVLIHDDVEIPKHTGASRAEQPGPGPILLQAHGSDAAGEVRFRNVWVVVRDQ